MCGRRRRKIWDIFSNQGVRTETTSLGPMNAGCIWMASWTLFLGLNILIPVVLAAGMDWRCLLRWPRSS